ncbi:hypothetical protein [Parapedobacter tibetensis]|uniref:hypothetical protein n=1 Tax=Parapedobacter tibetensis TaxID=2972951 RepID=UPI00214D27D6|nr:hypothetical protein [Parapedobacter tibetensis]
MVTEARKLHVIEQVLKIKSEEKLAAIEDFVSRTLKKSKKEVHSESPFQEFVGIWSKEEAAEIEKAIAESCETRNPDDWK